MFNFLKPKPNENLKTEVIKLSGLHCSSCATNIDMTLDDLPGVSSKTSYQRSETEISFDPSKIDLDSIKKTIADLGYQTN